MKRALLLLAGFIALSTSHVRAQEAAAPDAPSPVPVGQGDPHSGVAGAPARDRSLAIMNPSAAVPAGTIRVTVIDRDGKIVPNADVNVGVMAQGGARDRVIKKTDDSGIALFSGLAVGTTQAFRVNVPYQGALYSSTPFQLPLDKGFDVHIVRLEVTHEPRVMLQVMGQLIFEFRENRVHVMQQTKLMNMGTETYVYPEGGLQIPVPADFASLQAEPVMTDQHLTVGKTGLTLTGSVPPGAVVLSWSYDLPLRGSTAELNFQNPFRTYTFRVISDAPRGMHLDVRGFPPPEAVENEGHHLLLTQIERTPNDPPLETVHVVFTGLPGPGLARWVAVTLASLFLLLGLGLGFSKKRMSNIEKAATTEEERILVAIAQLEKEHKTAQIGPKYYERRRYELLTELALTLRANEKKSPSVSSSTSPTSH